MFVLEILLRFNNSTIIGNVFFIPYVKQFKYIDVCI